MKDSTTQTRSARMLVACLVTAAQAACGSSTDAAATTDPTTTTGTTTDANGTVTNGNAVTSSVAAGKRTAGPAVAANGNGMVVLPMTGCMSADYYAHVQIGSETFSLLMDSGSTTLAVAAKTCTSCSTADAYDTSSGTSLQLAASSEYGDGSQWAGRLYQDSVAMGSASVAATPAVTVDFAAITSQKDFFTTGSCSASESLVFDGIMGLGPDTLLEKGTTSFLTQIASAHKLTYDAFAVHTCDVGGEVMVGGYSTGSVTEEPQFVPMYQGSNSAGQYYAVSPKSILLDTTSVGLSAAQLGPMVVDNGTSAILFPPALFTAFINKLNQNKAYASNFSSTLFTQGDCEQVSGMTRDQLDAALPRMNLTFAQAGGTTAVWSVSATHSYLVPLTDSAGAVVYCPALSEGSSGDITILGNALMREHVVIFDRDNAQIGFAEQTGCDNTPAYGGQ